MKKKRGMSFRGRLTYFISMFLVVIIGLSSVYLFTPSNGASVIMINQYFTKLIQGEDQYQLNITDLGGGGTDASGNVISGNIVGPITAEGDYSLSLGDGDTIYWYHQGGGSCGCKYCGDWSSARVVNGGETMIIGKAGCAIYSIAIAYSNILGKQITPNDVLTVLGCSRTGNTWDANGSDCFFPGTTSLVRGPAMRRMSAAYGVSYEIANANGGVDVQKRITACLNKGGVYWASWWDAQCDWCGSGESHFMSIRKEDATNYYCYTSCRGKCSPVSGLNGAVITMNYPIEKNKCLGATRNPEVGYLLYIK